jgi:hypothetical protein
MTSAGLLVTAPIAPLLAEPVAGAEQVSQRLAGTELEVLEVRSLWFRVRGADRYEGFYLDGDDLPPQGHRPPARAWPQNPAR